MTILMAGFKHCYSNLCSLLSSTRILYVGTLAFHAVFLGDKIVPIGLPI